MGDSLFTLILGYDGGTYLVQRVARSAHDALLAWGADLDLALLQVPEGERADLLQDLREREPTPIKGCDAVWCTSLILSDKLGLVHVIATGPRSTSRNGSG